MARPKPKLVWEEKGDQLRWWLTKSNVARPKPRLVWEEKGNQLRCMVAHHDGGYDGEHCITERLQPFCTEHMLTQRHVDSF